MPLEKLAEAAEHPVPIISGDKTVAFLVTAWQLETLEILADPEAMAAIQEAREGRGTYYSPEEFERLLGDGSIPPSPGGAEEYSPRRKPWVTG